MKALHFACLLLILATSPSSLLATGPRRSLLEDPDYQPSWEKCCSPFVVVRDVALIHTMQVFATEKWLNAEGCGGAIEMEVGSVLEELDLVLQEGGSSLKQVVKLNVYVSSGLTAKAVATGLQHRFLGSQMPAVCYVTTNFSIRRARVAMDAVAKTNQSPQHVQRWMRTPKTSVSRKKAQAEAASVAETGGAILPVGPRVYISGQAEKGDGSLADATRQTMAGLVKTLDHLGLSRRDVVQLKAFLTPMKDASVAGKEMIAAFPGETPPPMVLVEWESSLPIEIELIAASPAPKETQKAEPLEFITPPWMKASPVFCRVVRVNHPATIYISDQYGETDKPDSAEEVRDLYGSLRRIAKISGSDLQHLAKATYYVSTDEVSGHLNTVRPEFYDPARPPSASKAKVRGTGREGRIITLDMIAVPKQP